MIPFKKILCPTDFSEASYEALKVANELALHFSAALWVVHVVSPLPTANVPAPATPSSLDIPLYEEELQVSLKKSLQELVEQKVSKKLQVRSVVVQGDAPYEIVRVAEQEKIDLIVTATHGQTGFHHFIFGSVAEKVVRLAPCAVLTIRASHEEG